MFDFADPCAAMKCETGQECDVDEEGEAKCQCISDCPHEEGPRVEVGTPTTRTGVSLL